MFLEFLLFISMYEFCVDDKGCLGAMKEGTQRWSEIDFNYELKLAGKLWEVYCATLKCF